MKFASSVRTVVALFAFPIVVTGSVLIDKLVVRYSSGFVRKFSFVVLSAAALLVGLNLIFNVCNQLLALGSIGISSLLEPPRKIYFKNIFNNF